MTSKREEEVLRLKAEARALVHRCLDHFGQIATPDEVERAATAVVNALPSSVRRAALQSKGEGQP